MSDDHGPSLEELTRARIPYVVGLSLAVVIIGVLAGLSAGGIVP